MNNIINKIIFTFFIIITLLLLFVTISFLFKKLLIYFTPLDLKEIRSEYNVNILPPIVDQNKQVPKGFIGNGLGYNSRPGSKEWDSIPMRGNHDRDTEATRMMRAWWPEFSWDSLTSTGNLYKMFYQDLSRVSYNDKGEICSIICPQFGQTIPILGNVKTEVTVTHIKGWVNENNKTMHAWAKMTYTIWLDEDKTNNTIIGLFNDILDGRKDLLPLSKNKAIQIPLYSYDKDGGLHEYLEFTDIIPKNMIHNESWFVSNVYGIGGLIKKQRHYSLDLIYEIILKGLNLAFGNAFQTGNKLNWDIYLTKPEIIDQKEYLSHVEKYRTSNMRFCDWNNCGPGYGTPIFTEYGYTYGIIEFIPSFILYLAQIQFKDDYKLQKDHYNIMFQNYIQKLKQYYFTIIK